MRRAAARGSRIAERRPGGAAVWARGLVIARESFADLRAAPRHEAELVSQAVLGEALRVRRERAGWLAVEATNGYRGWVRDWAVVPVGAADAVYFLRGPCVRVVVPSLPVLARPLRDADRIAEAGFLARFPLLDRQGAFLWVAAPGHGPAWLPAAGTEPWPEHTRPSPPSGLLEVGRRLLGTPYLWGGTTSRGYDCSGLTMRLYEWAGLSLPRDSREQAALGIEFDDPADARPGDLLFFGARGRPVSHVAIAAGGGRILHAGPPAVRVEQLVPRRRRARRSRRIEAVEAHRADLLSIFRGGRRYPRRRRR